MKIIDVGLFWLFAKYFCLASGIFTIEQTRCKFYYSAYQTLNIKMLEENDKVAESFRNAMKSGDQRSVNYLRMELPAYADHERIKNAQRMIQRNIFAMMGAIYFGLICILAVPSVLNVLIHTKKSSSVVTAYRRYAQTIFHSLLWFREDIKENSKAWKAIDQVRKMHSFASNSAKAANIGFMTQRDMANGQFSLMGFPVLFKTQLGIQCSQKEMEDFCHLWRVLGHLFAIEDEFNLCCESYNETLQRLEVLRSDYLLPNLTHPTKDFEEMTKFLVHGMQSWNPPDFYHPTIFFIKRAIGVRGYEYLENEIPQDCDRKSLVVYQMSYFNRFILWTSIMIRQFLTKYLIFRWIFNAGIHFAEFTWRYFPLIAIIRFGPRNAYVKLNVD